MCPAAIRKPSLNGCEGSIPSLSAMMFYKLDKYNRVISSDCMEIKPLYLFEYKGFRVSTVFLSMPHGFRNGLAVLFETMVFRGENTEISQNRYISFIEAEIGHHKTVNWLVRNYE